MRTEQGSMKALLAGRPGRKDLAQFAAEIMLVGTALPLYFLVRGFTHERVAEARDRAVQVIDLEKRLGIFWEADLQEMVLSHNWLVDVLNGMYLYGHLPIILVVALWLYFWHRPQYLLMRNAFLISGAVGLIVYVLLPVAPPRFMPEFGFTDTVFSQYGVSRPANPGFFRNEYAAIPSLHFGWNLLAGAAVWLASRNVALRSFAVLMPLATLAAIFLTANHYILDAVAGLLAVALGTAIALALRGLVLRYGHGDGGSAGAKAWRGWLSWLAGAAPPAEGRRIGPGQGTGDA